MKLKFKDYITILFFTFFICIKGMGLHALSHHESHDFDHEEHPTDCITCHLIINHQLTPVNATNGINFSVNPDGCIYVEQDVSTHYFNGFVNEPAGKQRFCRPPPYFIS